MLSVRPRGAMITAFAPIFTPSSMTILDIGTGAARVPFAGVSAGRPAERVTCCQIFTRRPIVTLLLTTMPMLLWPSRMSGLTDAPGASELEYSSMFNCLIQKASTQCPRL